MGQSHTYGAGLRDVGLESRFGGRPTLGGLALHLGVQLHTWGVPTLT